MAFECPFCLNLIHDHLINAYFAGRGGKKGGKSTSPPKIKAARQNMRIALKARMRKRKARAKRGGAVKENDIAMPTSPINTS